MSAGPDADLVGAARAGDEVAFGALVQRHRRELRVHCYRMLGSFDEAEDLVQETFLRAWRGIGGFAGRASVRAWLYRIATNACLDALDGRARRVLPQDLGPPSDASTGLAPRTDLPWLQPFPDRLLEPAAPDDTEPDAAAVARETIELAFLAAIQHLPPRQRAALLLRDVLGWAPGQIAAVLDSSTAAVNSALQRARATLREHLPARRADWAPTMPPTAQERAVLQRYMAAMESADPAAVAAVLAEDVRTAMPPWPMWFRGRDVVVAALAASWDPAGPGYVGRFRMIGTRANGGPAVATYVRGRGEPHHRPFAISVLRIEHGLVAEATAFHDPGLFPAFGLPSRLGTDDGSAPAPSPRA
jgi:RNA polymerase sigma-70 factor (ECF subfamily)